MVFICKTLSPFYLRMHYAKFGLNKHVPLALKKIFKNNILSIYIFAISWLSPIEKGHGPLLTNRNTHHPRMLCAKFGWNWPFSSWKIFFHTPSMYSHFFVIIFPWKRVVPFISTNFIPFTQGGFVQICPVVLEKKIF